jgi:hypothetical protein
MPHKKRYSVYGVINFPVKLNVFSRNENDAIQYAKFLLNSDNFFYIDADLYTTNGKIHYLVCEHLNIDWIAVTETENNS